MKRPDSYTPRPAKTPEQALRALMDRCARVELAGGDARRLLARWGVEPAEHDKIIARLIDQQFIDDSRFAGAYVREKARLNGWGLYKIRTGLRAKQIAEPVIEEALTQLDEMNMGDKLDELLRRKLRTTRGATGWQLRAKLLRYGTARGFDHSDVAEAVERLVKAEDPMPE